MVLRKGSCRFILGMALGQTIFRYKLHHIGLWMIFGAIWFFLRYQDYHSTTTAVTVTAIKIFDLALLIYISNYILVPRLLYREKYLWFALIFISMIAVSSIFKMQILGKLTHTPQLINWTSNFKTRLYDNIIPHFFLVVAGVAVKLIFDYFRMQKRLMEIAREKAEAELNFLKSQINPHFLFNSLNSVYFLIDKNNTEARKALHKFSDMLRYQLYEVNGEQISIEKEIGYLKDYIGLQKLRIENCAVEFTVDEGMKGFSIEPLLLIPLVENSFKHLSHFAHGKKNEIKIELFGRDGEMNFLVCNTTEGRHVHEISNNGGIGLKNVKRRLELLYPQKHELTISEKDGWFDVQLQIKMN
jgi:two-component system, LytTR family, sensor kinase